MTTIQGSQQGAIQSQQTAPTGNFGGAKYVVTWTDASGRDHAIPYIQSWYARGEARNHIKAQEDTMIWVFNKALGVYRPSEEEMSKTIETIKPPKGPRTNGKVFELLSNLAVSAQSLQRQARKGSVSSDDYDAMRAIVEELDVELEYTSAEGTAQ